MANINRIAMLEKKKYMLKIDSKFREKLCLTISDRFYFDENDRILIVSPHPDDESLGCSQILLNYGAQCDVLLITDGQKGNPNWNEEDTARVRINEFNNAMDYAGVRNRYFMHLMDSEIPKRLWLKGTVDLRIYDYIFVPNRYENHPDHVAVNRIMHKLINEARSKADVFEYEVWTPLVKPTTYIILDEKEIEKKCQLISYYECQLKYIDYVKRITALDCYRGVFTDSPYAEAYMLYVRPWKRVFGYIYEGVISTLYSIFLKLKIARE